MIDALKEEHRCFENFKRELDLEYGLREISLGVWHIMWNLKGECELAWQSVTGRVSETGNGICQNPREERTHKYFSVNTTQILVDRTSGIYLLYENVNQLSLNLTY